jgi:LysR family transcriptional regulator, hca operon transcriptional activator
MFSEQDRSHAFYALPIRQHPSLSGIAPGQSGNAYQAAPQPIRHCPLPIGHSPFFIILPAGRLGKDLISWGHAYELWEVEMELRHFRYFVAAADAGSLTVAAEQTLHTSQPSLSRQIRNLEQEVGTQLMNRGAYGVELTAAGKAFLEHARMALLQAEAAKEAALRAAQPSRPTFALGFLSGVEIDLLPEVKRILHDEFPDIEIRLSSDYSPSLAKALTKRKLDAAFMRPEEHMGDLACRRVRTDPLVFVFPSDHRLASQKSVAPEEIVNETFYFPSKSAPAVRRAVLEYFSRADIDVKPENEVHNVVHAISMVTSERAVMLLPAYTKRYLPDSITTRPVTGDVPTLDLVIAYHKANNSPILRLLISNLGKLADVPS